MLLDDINPLLIFRCIYSLGPQDYQRFSMLGKAGLKMLIEVLGNSRGAFVMWTRSGRITLVNIGLDALIDRKRFFVAAF